MKQTRVTIATGLYAPEIGGPATHTALLETELPKRDIAVTVVPFSLVRASFRLIRHVRYGFLLWWRTRGTDVLYALDPISVGLPALCVARLRRIRFVLRIAGDYAWEQASGKFGYNNTLDVFLTETHTLPFFVRVLCALERYVALRADHVVVPSVYLKSVVMMWGVPSHCITVAYNTFVPPPTHQATREDIRMQYGYSGVVLVSAGRLVPWKGFSLLIDIIVRLRSESIDACCVIVGDGPERSSLEMYAEHTGVSPYVRFVGSVSHDMLYTHLYGGDIFVLNTGYEGLSHVLLEAMACKVPIVTTMVGGNPEIIEHGKDGLLVPYNDKEKLFSAVSGLIHNQAQGARFVIAAHTRAHSFTKERLLNALVPVLRGVRETR